MLRSFSVRNFRCFPALELPRLGRVNLIAGKNNVGKTALLEALFLHLGPDNPEMAMRLNALRGIPWFESIPEETWGWLFLDKRAELTISLSSAADDGRRRELQVRLAEAQSETVAAPAKGSVSAGKDVSYSTAAKLGKELEFRHDEGSGSVLVSRAILALEDGALTVRFRRSRPLGLPVGIFLTNAVHHLLENAQRFSQLQEIGREGDVLHPLRLVEPRLRRLAVSVMGPGMPILQGDVGLGRLVPVPLMGDGVGRLLSYLLAIADASHGTVLIDEIENGLHHSVMRDLWEAIARFAESSSTQVFATTHSWECIQAARQAFAEAEKDDFLLHRLDRVEDRFEVATFDAEMLATAEAAGLEVR